MTMTHQPNHDPLAALTEVETEVERVETHAVAVLNRSEIEMQLDAAHRYRRSIGHFIKEAISLATLTPEVAESCIYALPRGGKTITGPSVRLAEIVASAYGNLHVGSRVLDAEGKEISSQGVAWDLEKNLRVTVEVRRRITHADGTKYKDDMVTVTGNAAASIALRNAIFRVVPRAYVDTICAAARAVAVGDAKTIGVRREGTIRGFEKLGVTKERVLARVNKATIDDIGLEDLELLIGIGTAIRTHGASIEEHFPEPSTGNAPPPAVSDAKSLEDKLKKGKPAPKVPDCVVCGKTIGTQACVQTTTDDGVVGVRHPECSPIGLAKREPGVD